MKILFISSGNSGKMSPIIDAQAQSLRKEGIEISHFLIQGKGIKGYLKNIFRLRKYLKTTSFDVVHAHYSLTAYVATLAGAKPLVVSLMGSDIKSNTIERIIVKIFTVFFWKKIIVKSKENYQSLAIKKAIILPNGVNLKQFYPIDKKKCQQKLNWQPNKIHLLFAANPKRKVKNVALVKKSLLKLQNLKIELHYLQEVPHNQIPFYLNAADGVMLSSLWEGSPNVIKEAMACNCPIVCTDVGDVKEVFGNVKGCFLATFTTENYVQAILQMIEFASKTQKTQGRKQIETLGLSSQSIAKKIIELYK